MVPRGSSKIGNAAIIDKSNHVNVEMIIDNLNQTQQLIFNHETLGKFEGKPVALNTLESGDNKVAKLVISSNYSSQNNSGRRSWMDNVKITKYALADVEDDITEDPWIATTDWEDPEIVGVETVKSAAADNAIYTLSGVRVEKAAKPGLYIKNGKKVVIK